MIRLATRGQEHVAVLHADFFQRLEAIGGESGADHADVADTARRQRRQHFAGVGLQPASA